MVKYDDILKPGRVQQTSIIEPREPIDQYYSDRSRILFCASFRRLQQKAQVFSLEPNAAVRTRMTHSLEVSDIGRSLARKICVDLISKNNAIINGNTSEQIVAIVENACLLHDIGNPPFGHFGEAAIKTWAEKNLSDYSQKAGICDNGFIGRDFFSFDGNPQGIRTVMHLHCERDQNGLNLTYPTLLSCIKYPYVAGEPSTKNGKPGYFLSEEEDIQRVYREISIDSDRRYPLSYIMEAADDISYALSDISDGIEKRIITLNEFYDDFLDSWDCAYEMPTDFCNLIKSRSREIYFDALSVKLSKLLMNAAAHAYGENHDAVWNGNAPDLFAYSEYKRVLDTIKLVSRKKLYRSIEAERIELSGYAIISGLLRHFGCLLTLNRSQFNALLDKDNPPLKKGLDLEWRVINQISSKAIKCYRYWVENNHSQFIKTKYDICDDNIEWWLRVHMIVDHIAGMTDRFALETYQMFEGMIHSL